MRKKRQIDTRDAPEIASSRAEGRQLKITYRGLLPLSDLLSLRKW